MKTEIMKSYEVYKQNNWATLKYDGRKKIFRGIEKNNFELAQKKHFEHLNRKYIKPQQCVIDLVNYLKKFAGTRYEKIIIEGNKHLWLASPVYLHDDYNKTRIYEKTEKNLRRAELINNIIKKI